MLHLLLTNFIRINKIQRSLVIDMTKGPFQIPFENILLMSLDPFHGIKKHCYHNRHDLVYVIVLNSTN